MFLKVLNKVNFKMLAQTKLFLIFDLLPFVKLWELLTVNHSLSERMIIFVPVAEDLQCSGCFITCIGVHFPAVELDNAIRFSTLSSMSGFLWHSSKWACRFGHFHQYTSGLEVLACSLHTDLNYVITMHQLHPSLSH